MHDVFISYSSKEYPEAETVRRTLEVSGISCWMAPGSIPGGSNYTKEIPVAIRECPVFVLILSKNAQESHWVLKELDAAVGHGKVILPFMLKNFTLGDEFSFLLSGTQWYAAYQDADAALEEMIARIKSITAAPRERPRRPRPAKAEPKSAPRPEPRPEPQPETEPAPQQDFVPVAEARCPACGGTAVSPLKNGKKSYDGTECAMFLLVPLLTVLVVILIGLLDFLAYGLFSVYFDPVFVLLIGIGSVPVSILFGINRVKEMIRRRRVRKHLRAWGVECRGCAKKFRVTAPFGTAFPWEITE